MVREPLVGRESELKVLEALLAEVADGDARFAAVHGEAGIGKTRLLEQLADSADDRGWLTLDGRAAEFERELPFGLVIDAFDAYLQSMDRRAMDRLALDRLGELAAVFPALHELGETLDQPASANERFRVHNAVRELVERLAARQPVLLTLDDLHWADGASLELITHLLRRTPQAAVMVVIAFRSGQIDGVVAKEIEGAARSASLTQVELGPLEPSATSALLGDLDGDTRERLHTESGGNPFYMLQLARAVQAEDAPRDSGPPRPVGDVPPSVALAIANELDRLTPGSRRLVEAAAVAGDPFELDLAATVAEFGENEAMASVDELAARDLVRPDQVPRRFRFRHPLVRSAVYGTCSPGTRLAFHDRSAAALRDQGAPATLMAHHVEQCAKRGDLGAVSVLREAGVESARQAPTSALRWFDAALRLLPADAPADSTIPILTALAGARAATGDFEGAHASLIEAIELTTTAQGLMRTQLIVGCAGIEQLLGRHGDAQRRLQGSYEDLSEPDSPEGISLMIALSSNAFFRSDYERMYEWADRADRAASTVGDPALTAAAAAARSMGAAFSERSDLAAGLREQASRMVDELTDEELAQRLDSAGNVAWAEHYVDRYEESCGHAVRALAIARSTGQPEVVPMLRSILGISLGLLGRLEESTRVLDEHVEAARLSKNPQVMSLAMLNRGYVALLAGDVETSFDYGRESVALAKQVDAGSISAHGGVAHAATLLELGEVEAARMLLLEAGGGEELPRIPGSWRLIYLEVLVECSLRLDRMDDAERAAALAQEAARASGLPLSGIVAERIASAIAAARGDPEAAVTHLEAAVSGSQELGVRGQQAASRAALGRALAAAGDRDSAVSELQRAAAEYEAMGAVRYRNQVESELRKQGRPVHRRSRRGAADGVGVESLTGRELEVARLVTDRLTNREIAGELFLSLKTIETHLRNIFAKLGVSSRVEVARIVEEAERTAA